jgi:hypothetical protein
VLRSTRLSLVLERRHDTRRERRRAAALDELDQRVQIDAALAREVLGEFGVEAGLSQSCATPGDDVGRWSSRPGLFSDSKVHVSLARRREPFLHPQIAYLAPTRMWSICHEPEDAEKANRGGRLRRPGCAGTRPRPPAEL